MLYIGSHTSYLKDKGLLGVVNESISYGANIFMFYTGSNQSTLRFPIDKELTKKAHEKMLEYGLDKTKCIVHAPFIINLANNTSEEKYEFYINFLRQELNRCIELDIRNIVLHPGSYTTLDRKTGIDGVNLLLEFMSGKGTEVGTSISDLKEIIDLLDQSIKEKVFVCLDTCHMNDAGIDISKFDEFLDDFDKSIGINKIKCIHVNDSMNPIGSHKDRHANLGYGTIGFDNLINVIYNQRLDNIPKILETPWINRNEKDAYAPYKYEIEMIKDKKFNDYINSK